MNATSINIDDFQVIEGDSKQYPAKYPDDKVNNGADTAEDDNCDDLSCSINGLCHYSSYDRSSLSREATEEKRVALNIIKDNTPEYLAPHTAEKCRLEILFGPMMGGKTSELQRRLRVKSLYKKVLAVNTERDKRYTNDGIVTHDGRKMDGVRVTWLRELREMEEYQNAEVVGIDEANFFKDVAEFVIGELQNTTKSFIVCALNGDKDKNLFGDVHLLLGHAEKIDFLPALCKRCGDGTQASFSASLIKFEGQEKIGGQESFKAVCRIHYDQILYTQQLDMLKRSFDKSSEQATEETQQIKQSAYVNLSGSQGC